MDAIRHVSLVPNILNIMLFDAEAPPGTPLGELTALPRPPSWQYRINHFAGFPGFTMGGALPPGDFRLTAILPCCFDV